MRVHRPDPGPQRTLDAKEVKTLVASIDTTTKAGSRDLPMVLLMLDTGLRAAEVCGLLVKHLEIPNRRLWVEGKGGKWREAIYSERTAVYLEDWLSTRAQVARPDNPTVYCGMGGLNLVQRLRVMACARSSGQWGGELVLRGSRLMF